MFKRLKTTVIVAAICFLCVEGALQVVTRFGMFAQKEVPPLDFEDKFWVPSEALGWDNKPNTKGTFSGHSFKGQITIGSEGNRLNALTPTNRKGYDDLLFIGDSTTACFEVDDAEALPARVEQKLRKAGLQVNVHNLGVRGYGTDQSVLKALRAIKNTPPSRVVYLFTGNDFSNNLTIKNGVRKYTKGVFIRDEKKSHFKPKNYPVTPLPVDAMAFVYFDGQCTSRIFRRDVLSFEKSKLKLLTLLRAAYYMIGGVPSSPWWQARVMGNRYNDILRAREITFEQAKKKCPGYFEEYYRFQIGMLRMAATEAPVDVVLYHHGDSFVGDIFKNFAAKDPMIRVLDLAESLREDGLEPSAIECESDRHLCEPGTAWASDKLARFIKQ